MASSPALWAVLWLASRACQATADSTTLSRAIGVENDTALAASNYTCEFDANRTCGCLENASWPAPIVAVAATTFAKLRLAVCTGQSEILLTGTDAYLFSHHLDISDSVSISGNASRDAARLSGLGNTRFFRVVGRGAALDLRFALLEFGNSTGDGGAIVVRGGLLTLTQCILRANAAEIGGAVSAVRGRISVFDTLFESNSAADGGALSLADRTVAELALSTFTQNAAGTSGGAISATVSNLTLRSSTAEDNIAFAGGAVFCNRCQSLAVTNVTFASNWAKWAGGALAAMTSQSVALVSCTIRFNVATRVEWLGPERIESIDAQLQDFGNGGAVALAQCNFTMITGCEFAGNEATSTGGALTVVDSDSVSITTCFFGHNRAFDYGGALSVASSSIEIIDSELVANTAYNHSGGGLMQYAYAHVTTVRCTFRENRASLTHGGGATIFNSTYTGINTTFIRNSAPLGGGGLYVAFGSEATCDSCLVWGNAANDGGGIFLQHQVGDTFFCRLCSASEFSIDASLIDSVSMQLTNSTVVWNTAWNCGGGIASDEGKFSCRNCTISNNTAFGHGGGLSLTESSTVQLEEALLVNNTSPDESSTMLQCTELSVVYTSLLHLDTSQRFSIDDSCVHYFYESYDVDGARIGNDLVDIISPSANRELLTRPCPAGGYSIDGLWPLALLSSDEPALPMASTARSKYADNVTCTAGGSLPGSAEEFFALSSNQTECVRHDCFTCPGGRYSLFSLERFDRIHQDSCLLCPVGKYLADDGIDVALHNEESDCESCPRGRYNAEVGRAKLCDSCPKGKYADEEGMTFCKDAPPGFVPEPLAGSVVPCAPGKYSLGGAEECTDCAVGQYNDESGQFSCRLSNPGYFTAEEGASEKSPCPPGKSSGTGAPFCTNCTIGRYQPKSAQSSCILSTPGHFVASVASAEQQVCTPGKFASGNGNAECSPCLEDSFSDQTESFECRICPIPLRTHGSGSRSCDACEASYYWDSSRQDEELSLSGQCTKCCVECEDACERRANDDECVRCETRGVTLETLDVRRGWWRASARSTTVYKCELSGACRGGTNTSTREQCSRGHKGALCGACRVNYAYSALRNKCTRCGSAVKVAIAASTGAIVLAALAVLIGLRLATKYASVEVRQAIASCVTSVLTGRLDVRDVADYGDEVYVGQTRGTAEDERTKRHHALFRSAMTKFKIVCAGAQIASSAQFAMPQVSFPYLYLFELVLSAMSFLSMDVINLGSLNCVVQLSYFYKLVIITLVPFALAVVASAIYAAALGVRWKRQQVTDIEERKERAKALMTYAVLLLLYIALTPSSTVVFQYFSCLSYDRGKGRNDLRVLAFQPSIKCTSPSYRRWRWYVILQIAIWPCGMPISVGILLWSYQHRLNPALESSSVHNNSERSLDEYMARHLRHYETAVNDAAKIVVRNRDARLKRLEFVYEEYRPSRYMFPCFELVRRVFLSAVLTVVFSGTMAQLAVGLFGSLCSHRIFAYFDPYIEATDSLVSEIAQTQLVIIYFAATVEFASRSAQSQTRIFHSTTAGVILIICFAASFVVAALIVLLECFGILELEEAPGAVLRAGRRLIDPNGRLSFLFRSSSTLTDRTSRGSKPGIREDLVELGRLSTESEANAARPVEPPDPALGEADCTEHRLEYVELK